MPTLRLNGNDAHDDRSHVRRHGGLDTTRFRPPRADDRQAELFA